MLPAERSRWLLLVVPVGYVLLVCGPALLAGGGLVLGSLGGDLGIEFVGLREFGSGNWGAAACRSGILTFFPGYPHWGTSSSDSSTLST